MTKFEGEHLAVQPTVSRMLHVESDYSFALGQLHATQCSGLGIHIGGGSGQVQGLLPGRRHHPLHPRSRLGFDGHAQPAEDIFLDDPENALLLSRPPVGPNWTVKPGEAFRRLPHL